MRALPFIKMQGLGNDFIVVDDLHASESRPEAPLNTDAAVVLCDRRFGIGADQILWLRRPQGDADARMEILNSDGSIAEMCGNGIRAVGIYLSRALPGKTSFRIETLAGMKVVSVEGDQVLVDMGAPVLGGGFSPSNAGESLAVDGQTLEFFEVSMGNPHAVFFVDDVASFPVEKLGPLIEKHPRFPKRTNVEFVEVKGPDQIQVRVWERGAGITLACGTGACASAVATLATHRAKGKLKVDLPGGRLEIEWNPKALGQPVLMKGPAEEVFRGQYPL